MEADFIAQHHELIGNLVAGVIIPTTLVGGLVVVYWLDARRSFTERNGSDVLGKHAAARPPASRSRSSANPANPSVS